MKNALHPQISPMLKVLPVATLSIFVSFNLASAVDYTWIGGTDNDWSNTANWSGNTLPATEGGRVTGSGNTVTIQNGLFLPTVNVPDFNHHGTGAGTPRFVIEDGASLTANFSSFGYGGPVGAGTIATVGAGSSLTWTTDYSGDQIWLMRDGNGVQTFNINGGTMNFDVSRLDFGFNNDRFSVFNVDGGVVNFTGTSMYGTHNVEDFASATNGKLSQINLLNGSSFNAVNSSFSNFFFYSGGEEVNTVFDLGVGSNLTAKFGGLLNNMAQFEDLRGVLFTSSTLGDGNLVYTDNLNGTFTISVVPEPNAYALLVGMGSIVWIAARRRRS